MSFFQSTSFFGATETTQYKITVIINNNKNKGSDESELIYIKENFE